MAQAFFERYAPDDVRAESAGQEPATAPWPEVVEAMSEVGIDISKRRPRKLDLEMQLHADWAVTLACGGTCPYVPGVVEEWDVDDPHGKPLDEVRVIRDEIERRVVDLVENKLDAIRHDSTSHQLRLQRLLPQLVDEFQGVREPDQIRVRRQGSGELRRGARAVVRAHARLPRGSRLSARRGVRTPQRLND
jgi:protein-tyrosine-phosphatase